MLLIGKPSISIRAIYFPWQTVSHNQRVMLFCFLRFSRFPHGSLNVPIEHHPTIRYMVYNGYYKVMSNIPKMGQLPTPVPPSSDFRFFGLQTNSGVASMQVAPTVFSRAGSHGTWASFHDAKVVVFAVGFPVKTHLYVAWWTPKSSEIYPKRISKWCNI